ncbi:hypothetical protein FT663_03786 [Candidozyma haemuli var. vulneris]|uniref:Uncharacterized protein n=1 Tax=Candidozyma haemuli TaxID=45357 RepID=A0A2V1AZ53_9ASCO|nr:hypothetical protein CXQ85_003081 [[Candida] haemuloni]KAF3986523.1 hypothetical protein FT662_04515 [[Candida] haemuloni var. vulneris]KAF3989043.1 hypothetical protein FT663_03786 [[Candida] haemuloni var. vulneris]PVH23347.1 hypothetical protein CXQ85_003081 [[Candida] haemuloni]
MTDPLDTRDINEATIDDRPDEADISLPWPSFTNAIATKASANYKEKDTSQRGIFERSLSTSSFGTSTRRNSRVSAPASFNVRSASVISNETQKSFAVHHNTEDFIPPVLDHTTEILTDPSIDFNEVSVVCCECEGENNKPKDRCKRLNSHKGRFTAQQPQIRSRSRSRSFICNSLMSALGSSDDEEDIDNKREEGDPESDFLLDAKTINFYSFNDILNREKDLERFNTFRMSNLLS